MKKVLIIGHFRPYRRGSIRIKGLAKYLLEFGWEPIILTGSLDEKPDFKFKILETKYPCFLGSNVKIFGIDYQKDIGNQLRVRGGRTPEPLRSFLRLMFSRFLMELFAYPDEDKYWKAAALKVVEKFLKEEKIDAIISVWPETSHLIARELKNRYKIPWVADFPDLWTQNYNYGYGNIRKFFEKRLEIKTLLCADALSTISSPMAELLKSFHKKETYVISHGFDPEEINSLPINLTNKFTLTYTGQIYPDQQDPLKVLIALRDLIAEKIINYFDVEVRFYGPKIDWLDKKIKNYKLSNIIKQYGIISRIESLRKQWESQILILFKWEDERSKGVYSGKIFEYLAARRPILATGGSKDVVSELLEETKAGIDALDIKDIKVALKSFYCEYKQKGKISFNGDIEKINKYNSKEMAKKFADILNKITKS